eukprot:TRINITY_DN12795_c0_g3_i2.p1 TRINITY_DN12795_c0_g3~~TRINITY_DN12795_c0_g3_i2.p1  ORF type:complete len:265 (-),score=-0.80 TRINITY_DN12795_c0_g3_i2:100-873(-)
MACDLFSSMFSALEKVEMTYLSPKTSLTQLTRHWSNIQVFSLVNCSPKLTAMTARHLFVAMPHLRDFRISFNDCVEEEPEEEPEEPETKEFDRNHKSPSAVKTVLEILMAVTEVSHHGDALQELKLLSLCGYDRHGTEQSLNWFMERMTRHLRTLLQLPSVSDSSAVYLPLPPFLETLDFNFFYSLPTQSLTHAARFLTWLRGPRHTLRFISNYTLQYLLDYDEEFRSILEETMQQTRMRFPYVQFMDVRLPNAFGR